MIKTTPWTGGTDEEYETQHFGFGSQRLKIAVRQMVEQKITTGVKDMESYLQESLDLNETDKATLTRSCDKLIKLYCERAGPSLQIIDREIERVLEVPQNVLLPDDEIHLQDLSDADHEKLKEEVTSLRKRVERGALMEALLTAEEEELSTVEKVCETAKKDMEVLDLLVKHTEDNNSVKTIHNETDFLCASAPFMKKNDDINIFE
ncbi:protein MIS12 homolog [Ostrinia furnacalis]|uniref:protein MIS12 homolog n=1 Tax=Ostrinia furnacalis TaxID=93504 RepID=UPI00103A9551|nr:protein MIS12 homolog [Ostrinia furnacalis]